MQPLKFIPWTNFPQEHHILSPDIWDKTFTNSKLVQKVLLMDSWLYIFHLVQPCCITLFIFLFLKPCNTQVEEWTTHQIFCAPTILCKEQKESQP